MLKRVPSSELSANLEPALQVKISSLATAVPEHCYTQDETLELAAHMFPDDGRLTSVFANTGIEQRYSCVPLDWFSKAHNWVDRNEVYERSANGDVRAGTHPRRWCDRAPSDCRFRARVYGVVRPARHCS